MCLPDEQTVKDDDAYLFVTLFLVPVRFGLRSLNAFRVENQNRARMPAVRTSSPHRHRTFRRISRLHDDRFASVDRPSVNKHRKNPRHRPRRLYSVRVIGAVSVVRLSPKHAISVEAFSSRAKRACTRRTKVVVSKQTRVSFT